MNNSETEIVLQALTIRNFKGISELTISFDKSQTNIFGRNGIGKTTIVDAWRWLLTGKNSGDQKDFEIKPIDEDGNRSQRLENEVTATVLINGKQTDIRRVHREKWVKRRGEEVAEFSGNETIYFWNEVPCSMKEFNEKVNEVISEDRLKMLTDTTYFNSLNWKERRAILTHMAGEVSDAEIAASDAKFKALEEVLASGKTLEDYKKEIGAKKKRAKDELVLIPARIDEALRSKPDALAFDLIRRNIAKVTKELSAIEEQIVDSNKAFEAQQKEVAAKRNEIFQMQKQLSDIAGKHDMAIHEEQSKEGNKAAELQEDLLAKEGGKRILLKEYTAGISQIKTLEAEIKTAEASLQEKKGRKAELLEAWKEANAKHLHFSEEDSKCPTCQREWEGIQMEEKQEAALVKFNEQKQKSISDILSSAEIVKRHIASLEQEITDKAKKIEELKVSVAQCEKGMDSINEEIATLKAEIKAEQEVTKVQEAPERILAKRLQADKAYQELQATIEKAQAEVAEYKPTDITELIDKKAGLQKEVDALKSDLNNEALIKKADARVEELKEQEHELASFIAEQEGVEFLMQELTSIKMKEVEDKVNKMFSFVKFRMFDQQINGATVEVCDTLINGVPYSDANSASKINAGLDIANVISKHYGLKAPIFLDGRESVTEIIPTDLQIINLIVSPEDVSLRVEATTEEAVSAA